MMSSFAAMKDAMVVTSGRSNDIRRSPLGFCNTNKMLILAYCALHQAIALSSASAFGSVVVSVLAAA